MSEPFYNFENFIYVTGRDSANLSSSNSQPLTEDEEREDTEPRCSFCDAPYPNIDA